MKAERNEDGTYSLTGMTSSEVLDLFQFVYDEFDSRLSSGDNLDETEQAVVDGVYDLYEKWKDQEGGF